MPQEKLTIVFDQPDGKKHSTRFDSSDKDAAVSTIYVRKPFFQSAKKIRVTLEEVPE